MEFCYYPGCTLKNKAKNFNNDAIKICNFFNITLNEIDEWQCCGGLYTFDNDVATKLSSVRNLVYAKEKNLPLMTLCSSCFNVLKRVNYDMKNNLKVQAKVNSYLELVDEYKGETKVYHLLEILRDFVGFDNLTQSVKNPLNKKVACYYGCQLLRPSKILNFDNPENPQIMQNLVSSLGGENINFAYQNECCGSYKALNDTLSVDENVKKITNNAINSGAEIIITACPLCYYNLKKYSTIPVKYFTEILAYCLGLSEKGGYELRT